MGRKGKGKARQVQESAEDEMSVVAGEKAQQGQGKGKGNRAAGESSRLMKLRAVDDYAMLPGQTSCTRCLRLGRKCSAVVGQVCESCKQSKVRCPLFTAAGEGTGRISPLQQGPVPPSGPPSTKREVDVSVQI